VAAGAAALPATPRAAAAQAPPLAVVREAAGAVVADPAPSPRDARRAQRAFEGERRRALRLYTGRSGVCEVRFGELCYWHNNGDDPPPPERPAVGEARTRLLDVLARAAAAAPDDDWIAGQRVRYLVEAGRADSALAAARACAGTPAWCLALGGYARHAAGDAAAALAAFDSAAALLPARARCQWRDVSSWLGRRAERAWRRAGCDTPERAAVERRFWRLAQPLWSAPANDLRAEWEARRVEARMLADAENPQALAWTATIEQVGLRYGWPTAWSRSDDAGPTFGAGPGAGVIGHEPAPSYAFVPDDEALAAALAGAAAGLPVTDGAWAPLAPDALARYAPRWVRGGLLVLDDVHAAQVARFRRGDTLIVVGAWTLARDTTGFTTDERWRKGPLRAALVALDGALDEVGRSELAGAPRTGALAARVAGAGQRAPRLVGLELTAAAEQRAGWARRAVAPLAADASLSDLLLVAPGTSADAGFDGALAAARGTPAVRAGTSVGLYWERYGAPGRAEPDSVAVTATRLTRTVGERLRSAVGLDVVRRPVAVRYVDRLVPGAPPGRTITIAWPDVPAGEYRVEVVVTPSGGPAATTATTVRVERF
jgi:hypothetical protein